MRIGMLPVVGWLMGGAWLWGAVVHGRSTTAAELRPTYPNCSISANIGSLEETFGTIRIANQTDADRLTGCQMLWGNIRVTNCSPGVTSITLVDLQILFNGALSVDNCESLRNFSAPALTSITNISPYSDTSVLVFDGLPRLTEIQLPYLSKLNTLHLLNTPVLSTVVTSLASEIGSMLKISGTGLSNLDFVYPGSKIPTGTYSLTSLNISGNPNLQEITVPNYSFDDVFISDNGPSSHINLWNLNRARNLAISAAASLNVSSLAEADFLSITDSSMVKLDLSSLTTLGGLYIANNTLLRHLKVPVADIGYRYGGKSDVEILDNPELYLVDFNTVEHIYGNMVIKNPTMSYIGLNNLSSCKMVDVSGYFHNFSLPSYTPNSRDFMYLFINSTDFSLDCRILDEQYYNIGYYNVTDSYYCATHVAGYEGDKATHWYPPKTERAPKKGIQKPGIMAAVIIGSIAGAALLIALFWRMCVKIDPRTPTQENTTVALDELPPDYSRIPKPHEVPPVYGLHAPAGSEVTSVSDVSSVVTPGVAGNAVTEHPRGTASLIGDSTAARVPTPPEYTHHASQSETRRSADLR